MAETFNGKVEIVGWDENKVDISGTKYGSTERPRDGIKLETHNSPDLVEIRAIHPASSLGSSGARLIIRVPKGAVIDRVTSSNGSIRVERVGTAAHLKTSNGAIRVENASGDLDARTANGQIEIDHFTGNCDVETSNGAINVRMAKAPSSPVRLPGNTQARVSAATSNASVSTEFTMATRFSGGN